MATLKVTAPRSFWRSFEPMATAARGRYRRIHLADRRRRGKYRVHRNDPRVFRQCCRRVGHWLVGRRFPESRVFSAAAGRRRRWTPSASRGAPMSHARSWNDKGRGRGAGGGGVHTSQRIT